MQGFSTRPNGQREAPTMEQSSAFCARAASLAFQATDYNAEPIQGEVGQQDMNTRPTVLLLTQNVGAIKSCNEPPSAEVCSAGDDGAGDGDKGTATPPHVLVAGESLAGNAIVPAEFVRAEVVLNNEEEALPVLVQDGEGTVALSERTKQLVYEFVADLRLWIHRTAAFADARRRRARLPPHSLPLHGDISSQPNNHKDNSAIGDTDKVKARDQREVDWWTVATDCQNTAELHPPQIDVIVIHFQEVGAADREKVFIDFFARAIATKLLPEAGWTSGLLMYYGDHDAADGSDIGEESLFTGVGTIVFLSPRMCPISSLLLIPHRIYIPVLDDPCSYGGSILRVFHTARFTSSPRSQKGFLFISLRLGTTVLNLCNVHLFHDADNTKAVASSPSRYVKRRLQACLEAVAECLPISGKSEPFFIFGDFNTRLDGYQLAQHLQQSPHRMELRTGPKMLRCPDSFWAFFADPDVRAQLHTYDCEPQQLLNVVAETTGMNLAEMPVYFAPTYLRLPSSLEERVLVETAAAKAALGEGKRDDESREANQDEQCPTITAAPLVASRARTNFERRRIPAWCDRIVFNPAALEFITSRRGNSGPLQQNRGSEGESHARHSSSPDSGSFGGDDVMYLYDAVSLLHTDHDGVFLLF